MAVDRPEERLFALGDHRLGRHDELPGTIGPGCHLPGNLITDEHDVVVFASGDLTNTRLGGLPMDAIGGGVIEHPGGIAPHESRLRVTSSPRPHLEQPGLGIVEGGVGFDVGSLAPLPGLDDRVEKVLAGGMQATADPGGRFDQCVVEEQLGDKLGPRPDRGGRSRRAGGDLRLGSRPCSGGQGREAGRDQCSQSRRLQESPSIGWHVWHLGEWDERRMRCQSRLAVRRSRTIRSSSSMTCSRVRLEVSISRASVAGRMAPNSRWASR